MDYTSMAKQMKKSHPRGTRVRLIRTNDPHTRLVPGIEGTVSGVDDVGTVHVNWDDGSRLGLLAENDQWEKV